MKQALILIDIQNDYFPDGAMELVGMEAAAQNARSVLDSFRTRGALVFHIQHLAAKPDATFFVADTIGVEHNVMVKPEPGETLIQKNFPNAFRATNLEEQLLASRVEQLIIVGAMSHMCIDATTRAAFDLEFQCTVLQDACATRDLQFDGQTIDAQQVHGSFMAALAAPYAAVVATTDYLGNPKMHG